MEATIVRRDVGAWFELHGCVIDKGRKNLRARVLTPPERQRLDELSAKQGLAEDEQKEKRDLEGLRANKLQLEIAEIIKVCRRDGRPPRIVTLKGRQQGSSTISVAAAVHELRGRNAKGMIIGDEFEKSVKNLVKMFRDFVKEDRFNWGNTFTETSGKFSHGSELVTETANDPRAGASGTIQVLVCTEVAHWKETGVISAAKTFAALLNCVPELPDTLVIVESTPNGASGVYYETYCGAITLADYLAGRIPENWNGYFKVAYFWWEHPEYDLPVSAEEGEAIMRSLSTRETELIEELKLPVSRLAWRRKTLKSPKFNGDEDKFEEEYAADEVRCFLLTGRRAFSIPMVQRMKKEAREAPPPVFGELQWSNELRRTVAWRLTGEDDATVKVWEGPRPGCRYLLPVDPMTGASQTVGKDPDNHGAGIIRCGGWKDGRWFPPALVARLADCFAEKREGKVVCRWDIDVLAVRVAMLSRWYGGATIVPEMNMDRGMVELLKGMGANLYRRKQFNRLRQKTEEALGWMTTAATRGAIIDNLKRAVRLGGEPGEGLAVYDLNVLREFEAMVVNANGKEEAMGGSHDDQILMLAIGMANLDSAVTMPYPKVKRGRGWGDDDDYGRPDNMGLT